MFEMVIFDTVDHTFLFTDGSTKKAITESQAENIFVQWEDNGYAANYSTVCHGMVKKAWIEKKG